MLLLLPLLLFMYFVNKNMKFDPPFKELEQKAGILWNDHVLHNMTSVGASLDTHTHTVSRIVKIVHIRFDTMDGNEQQHETAKGKSYKRPFYYFVSI